MMDSLIDVEDDNGRKLGDEDIIDIMLMYLNAGHESSGHITMWATYFLQKHPEYLQKAKVLLKLFCCLVRLNLQSPMYINIFVSHFILKCVSKSYVLVSMSCLRHDFLESNSKH